MMGERNSVLFFFFFNILFHLLIIILQIKILVTGGGRLNPIFMRELHSYLHSPSSSSPPPLITPVESAGLNGDMLEAQAFAYLAVRVVRGLPLSGPMTTGVSKPTVGGRVSEPKGKGREKEG